MKHAPKEDDMAEPTKQEMDAAAEEAFKELAATCEPEELAKFAEWWKRWYVKAGHRRLGRGLVEWWG